MSAISQTFESIHPQPVAGRRLWTGRILSGLVAAFCILDGAMKLAKPEPVLKATLQLGFPESAITGIGVVLLLCTVLYLVPRTAVAGAVLLTGYLGGAVAAQVRVSAPSTSILFPLFFACLAWAGLYLRDNRVKALLR